MPIKKRFLAIIVWLIHFITLNASRWCS